MKSKAILSPILTLLVLALVACGSDDPTGIYEVNDKNCTPYHFVNIGIVNADSKKEKKARDLRKRCGEFYLREFTVNYDNCETANPHYAKLDNIGLPYEVLAKIRKECEIFKNSTDTRYLPVEGHCNWEYTTKLPSGPGKDQLQQACADITMKQQQALFENIEKGISCPFDVCQPARENTK